jgi:cell division inhibitor SulA
MLAINFQVSDCSAIRALLTKVQHNDVGWQSHLRQVARPQIVAALEVGTAAGRVKSLIRSAHGAPSAKDWTGALPLLFPGH